MSATPPRFVSSFSSSPIIEIRSCSLIVRVIADAIAAGASAVTVEEMAANGRPEEQPAAEEQLEAEQTGPAAAEQPQEEVPSE